MPCLIETIRESDETCQALITQIEQTPSLQQMLVLAWQVGRRLAVLVVEEMLAQRAQAATVWEACPLCGTPLESKGLVRRQLKTVLGVIRWRRVGRCPQRCKSGQVAPLDDALGLQPQQKSDAGLQQAACVLATFVPFETAALLLHQLSGVTVSAATIWTWVQHAGQQMMQQVADDLSALAAGVEPPRAALDAQTAADTLLLGVDGVMVPFRPHAQSSRGRTRWREVKVAIVARLGQTCTRAGQWVPRIYRHRVAAVLGSVDQIGDRLWLEALKQGVRHATQVVWLSDGARGLWRLFHERFAAYAVGVLDFYHATQQLWAAITIWRADCPTAAHAYLVQARHRLRHGEVDALLADIAAARHLPDLPQAAYDALSILYHYLDKHRDHIPYDQFKAAGLPIGSGIVESTCKWLIQQRFKGVGMRWSEDGFNHLLHLRLAWVNGRFDDLFAPTLPSPNS